MTYFSSQHQSSWIECKWKNTQIFHSKNNLVHKLQVTCRIVFGFWSFTWELKPWNKIVEPFPKVWPLGLHQRGFFFPAFLINLRCWKFGILFFQKVVKCTVEEHKFPNTSQNKKICQGKENNNLHTIFWWQVLCKETMVNLFFFQWRHY